MTVQTKRALIDAFLDLLETKPLDKITVREIVSKCGLSRNTFYYHFHDIYELVEEIFSIEREQLLAETRDLGTLERALRASCRMSREHAMALYHLYHSSDHERVKAYVRESAEIVVRSLVERTYEGNAIKAADLDIVVSLFAGMIAGVVSSIMRGEHEDVDAFIDTTCVLLDGTLDLMVENAEHL